MGEIFFIIGVWLVVSGAMDIHEALKIKDSYENSSEAYGESDSSTETVIEGGAVA